MKFTMLLEGFGIQDRSGSDEMLLMLDYGIFTNLFRWINLTLERNRQNLAGYFPMGEVEPAKIMQLLFLPMVDIIYVGVI